MRSIRLLDEAGQDLRVWCFRCARGERIDAIIWQRFDAKGWDHSLPAAAARFRCKICGHLDEVLIVPATRPVRELGSGRYETEQLVAAVFHHYRSQRKRGRGHGWLIRDRVEP